MIFNRLFNEQINILGNGLSFSPSLVQKSEESGLDIGNKTTRIFIAGIGFLNVEHDNQFDVYTAGGELYAGLPERSYCGALLLDDKTLGILDLLVNSPYQDISDWVKAFSSFIDETKLSLDKFKKELSNLEIDNLF